eukprot:1141936-Pelagomonas_calceolata.AAC.4
MHYCLGRCTSGLRVDSHWHPSLLICLGKEMLVLLFQPVLVCCCMLVAWKVLRLQKVIPQRDTALLLPVLLRNVQLQVFCREESTMCCTLGMLKSLRYL